MAASHRPTDWLGDVAPGTSKSFSRFEPTPSRTPEECERHYTEVHVPMAQNLLAPMLGLRSYHVDRAVAEADVGGGWAQRPRAWRFVVLRFAPGKVLAFTPEQDEMIARDHVNCLCRLRHCDVEETVLLDRLRGQFALAKFLCEADRAPGADPDAAWRAFAALGERMRATMADCAGARCLILNRALTELACEPIDAEGQRPVGLLEATPRLGYIEAYFDHPRWGEEALTPLVSAGLLRDPQFAEAHLLRVEESAALDRR